MVTGDAVNVAARLEAAAAPGRDPAGRRDLRSGARTVRSSRSAPLTLKGKSEPVPAWRLVDGRLGTSRQARPQDAPLVGRRRPLRLLDDAFREAVEERVCHLFTVLGVAGVGKSRLVDEFVASLGDEAPVATGRCLAYGSGITYWPVAEALRSGLAFAEAAPDGAGRTGPWIRWRASRTRERITAAIGNLLGSNEAPVDQDELFWAVRRTFEALARPPARSRPRRHPLGRAHVPRPRRSHGRLDSRCSDPADRDGPAGAAREAAPAGAAASARRRRSSWRPLSEVESDELVAEPPGPRELPAELRTRIEPGGRGQPAVRRGSCSRSSSTTGSRRADDGWAAVGDLRDLAMPPTIQALLAARLDSLGDEERTVIEQRRGRGQDLPPRCGDEPGPRADAGQGPRAAGRPGANGAGAPDEAAFAGEEAYRFRHLLIRDAAYQSLAKQTRSELHERFAAWLERMAADRAVQFDEIIAYHLEQAYRYRIELGPPDDAARALALHAGGLLAGAGERAHRRGDIRATIDLLTRATDLLPGEVARGRRLAYYLGNALFEGGDAQASDELLSRAIAEADAVGDEGAGALAAVVRVGVRSSTRSTEQAELVREFEHLAPILERTGDQAGARLARAGAAFALFASGRAAEAAKRAAALVDLGPSDEQWYRTALVTRNVSLMWGPTPVEDAIAVVEAQVQQDPASPSAFGAMLGLARLRVLQGRFADARDPLARARDGWEQLGNRHYLAAIGETEGNIDRFMGDLESATRAHLGAFQAMRATGDLAFASTQAAAAAAVLLDKGDLDEALRFATISVDTSSADDVMSQAGGRAIQARVLASRGEHDAAEALAREAETIIGATDYLHMHGDVVEHLAHVLHDAGRTADAAEAARRARDLYERKGATFLVERIDRLIREWERLPG